VRLKTETIAGAKVYVLTWTATASGSGTKITESLVLAATTETLPISETATANGGVQTVTLGHWGEQVTVAAPRSAIPYPRLPS
jgi:hypothetical protein